MSMTMDDSIKRWAAKRIEAANAIGPREPPRGAGGRDEPGQDDSGRG